MKATLLIEPKKITHAGRACMISDNQVAEISEMLGWTDQQYYEHQFEQYEEFLKRSFYGCSIETYNKVRYSELMRGLWNNEWILRNEEVFLPMARFHLFNGMEVDDNGVLFRITPVEGSKEHVRDEYEFIHSGKLLYNNSKFLVKYYHILKLISKL